VTPEALGVPRLGRVGGLGISPRRSFRADRGRALQVWQEDQRRWVRSAARALQQGGRMVVIVGDGNVLGTRIDTIGPVIAAGREAGLLRVASATVERWDDGVRAMRPEHAVCFERPQGAEDSERDEAD
jgi:hypothetical protein